MRTAVYVRVSTARAKRRPRPSSNSSSACGLTSARKGRNWQAEAIFRDDGVSGATLNRPGLDRLRDAVRAGSIERVLVTDPDRLARNYVQLMILLEELERCGCRVEFLDRPMGQDPQDHLLLQIRGAVGSDAVDARDGLYVPRWVCMNLQRRRR
jgi:site-specific DNA recombinase